MLNDIDTEAISQSLLDRTNSALTTDSYQTLSYRENESQEITKTQPEFKDQKQINRDFEEFNKIIQFPKPYHSSSINALQEWEGYVTEINDKKFSANLIDITAGDLYEKEEADIPIDEISEEDASNLQIGSIFRWVIGYERSKSGIKKRVSYIVFRDLPVITESDLRESNKWASKIMKALKQLQEPNHQKELHQT